MIELYIIIEDPIKAKEVYDSHYNSNDIMSHIYEAHISRLNGDYKNYLNNLNNATSCIKSSSTPLDLSILADEFYKLEKFKDAAEIYEKFIDKEINSNVTRRLINCYYRSGEIGNALKICKSLREKYDVPLEYVTEVEISIYTEIDDLHKAKNLVNQYLNFFPSNFDMKISRAIINLHANEPKEVDEFLKTSINLEELSLEQFQKLAYLCHFRAFDKQYIDVLYEMRRKYFNEYKAHAEYFKSLIFKDNGPGLTPIKVDIGMAVCLKNGMKEWYILEEREDTDFRLKEISPNNPLSKDLVGKYQGDTVTLGEGISAHEAVIDEIKTKYVHAAHESSEILKVCKDNFGFYPITLDSDKNKMFDPFIEILKERHTYLLKVKKFFKEKSIPVGAYAQFVGSNIIDVWNGIVRDPNLNLKCCSESDENDYLLLKKEKKLIVDLISLLTITEVDVKDNIVKTFGKLGIAQTTIDEIIRNLNEQKMLKERGSLQTGISSDDEFTVWNIPLETIETNIKYLEDLLKWIEENCDIIPCRAALKINRNKRTKHNDMLGQSFMDTILIASEDGNLLYSDDGPLRIIAKKHFNAAGVGTLQVLKKCLKKDNLEKNRYNKVIVKLICFNYINISYNAEIIMAAAEESGWLPLYPYTHLINLTTTGYNQPTLPEICLKSNNAKVRLEVIEKTKQIVSMIKVLNDFISKLTIQPISKEQYEFLTNYLINQIACRNDRDIVLYLLGLKVSAEMMNRLNNEINKHAS